MLSSQILALEYLLSVTPSYFLRIKTPLRGLLPKSSGNPVPLSKALQNRKWIIIKRVVRTEWSPILRVVIKGACSQGTHSPLNQIF
jgi:hypothetical protein